MLVHFRGIWNKVLVPHFIVRCTYGPRLHASVPVKQFGSLDECVRVLETFFPTYKYRINILEIEVYVKNYKLLLHIRYMFVILNYLEVQRSPLNLITDKVIILLIRYIYHAQNHFLCYLYSLNNKICKIEVKNVKKKLNYYYT